MTLTFRLFFAFFSLSLVAVPLVLTLISSGSAQAATEPISGNSSGSAFDIHMQEEELSASIGNIITPGATVMIRSINEPVLEKGAEYTYSAVTIEKDSGIQSQNTKTRLMPSDTISLDNSLVEFAAEVLEGVEQEITLTAHTSDGTRIDVGGEKIYLSIKNGCKKLNGYNCVRLSPGDTYYSNDVLSSSLYQLMEDNNDGTYTAKYTITGNAEQYGGRIYKY